MPADVIDLAERRATRDLQRLLCAAALVALLLPWLRA